MDNWKKAAIEKVRINSKVGPLAPEQLYDLKVKDLDTLAVELKKEYEESGAKSFLVKETEKDVIAKLKFDLVLEVLKDKMEAAEKARTVRDNREHDALIDSLIAKKKNENLESLSIEELIAMKKQ